MMREVSTVSREAWKVLDEKFPCVSCRSFFSSAILYAIREKIPYIALCADRTDSDHGSDVRG